MNKNRDDFSPETIEMLKRRAAYICSNPDCHALTISSSEVDENKAIYIGKAAHISAASKGGARYDDSLTSEQRASINNGVFLCSSCADMIDKNNGIDFSKELLLNWKTNHEEWTRLNLNKKISKIEHRQTVINVSSYGQQGGITAGIVNVGKPQRQVGQQMTDLIDKAIADNPDKEISIITEMNDTETYRVGEQILKYLSSKGHVVKGGVGRMMANRPLTTCVNINTAKSKIEIYIGSQ